MSDPSGLTPDDEDILERLAALVAARRAKAPRAELESMQRALDPVAVERALDRLPVLPVWLGKSEDGRVFLFLSNAAYSSKYGVDRATMSQEIGPGWKMYGMTFEEWNALPPGPYFVPPGYDLDDDYCPPQLAVPESRRPMRAYLWKFDDRLTVWAHGSEEDHPRVTIMVDIEPGSRTVGKTYEEWAALDKGWHEIPAGWDPDKDHPAPGQGVPE
jgi:hypothetical protein